MSSTPDQLMPDFRGFRIASEQEVEELRRNEAEKLRRFGKALSGVTQGMIAALGYGAMLWAGWRGPGWRML